MSRKAAMPSEEVGDYVVPRQRLRPYPEYHESGVKWLDRIPSHWGTRRLKNVLACKITDGPHTTPAFIADGVPFLSVDGIQDGELVFDGCRYVSEVDHQEYTRKAFPRRDDILLGKAASTGKIARVKVDFEFSIWSPLALIRTSEKQALAPFIEYALKSPGVQAQIDVLCTSNTQKNISMDDIPLLAFALPPLPEQEVIAAFLDRETARIDELIAKKQRLIELLAEKRTALISHAVTKGLNPDAPMKDSGVEWLGNVPRHWHEKQLKFAVTFQRGHDLPSSERVEGTIPVVTSAGPSSWHNRSAARAPGIVTGRYGTIGTFYLVEEDYWPLNTTLYSIDLRGNVPRFLWYMLHALADVFLVNSAKSAVPGVDRNDLHPIRVVVPPQSEQNAIVKYLDGHLWLYAGLAQQVEKAIAKLREYRSALIFAAVTGKIDVRKESA